MRVFLIGMMGSGKTTLGYQLAKQLNYTFVDLDDYIEKRENKTIAALFEQEGQQQFRQLERNALEAVAEEFTNAIISTGGGAPCFHDNMTFINQHGISIFLDVSVDELVRRLQQSDLSVRPLLAGKTEAELKAFLTTTLTTRRPFYERASYKLTTPDCTVGVIKAILNNN